MAREAGYDVSIARYDFKQGARTQIAGRDSRMLKIVFDKTSRQVLGVHILVEGAVLVKMGLPLWQSPGPYIPPTLAESFVMAVRHAMSARQPGS